MEHWDQLKVLTADNLQLQDALDEASKEIRVLRSQNSELRSRLESLPSPDSSQPPPREAFEDTVKFRLQVQLAGILPKACPEDLSIRLWVAGLLEVVALVVCMAGLGEGTDMGVLNGTYFYFQIASTIGAGPVEANQARGVAALVVMLTSAASFLLIYALSTALARRRARAFAQVLVGEQPEKAWGIWEADRLLVRLPVLGSLAITALSLVIFLSAEEDMNAHEALFFTLMSLSTVGVAADTPGSDGGKAWGLVLCTAVWILSGTVLALFLDRAIHTFVLSALNIATGRPPAQQNNKVAPAPVMRGRPLHHPKPEVHPRAARRASPAIRRASPGVAEAAAPALEDTEECQSLPGSAHLMAAKMQRPAAEHPMLGQECALEPSHPHSMPASQPEKPGVEDRSVEVVQQAFCVVSGGEAQVRTGMLGEVCEGLGIVYGPAKLEMLGQRLDPNQEGFVGFDRFYGWLVKRDRKKHRLRDAKLAEDGSWWSHK